MIQRHLALVAAVAAFALPLGAAAQSAPPPPAPPAAAPSASAHHHHGGRYLAAIRSLNLSDDQKQQIAADVKAMRTANAGADPATRKANARKLRSQIVALLTPDQRTQLHAQMKALRAARQAPGAVPAPPAPQ